MHDAELVSFLREQLPRLGLRWSGFRKVRGTLRKRLSRRLGELGLADLEAYGALLGTSATERARFDALCRIPISRFYRDRKLFEMLERRLLPVLARRAARRGIHRISCWSAGCASGEEPYSLRLAWARGLEARFPHVALRILATDAEATMVQRATRACYGRGSFRDLPPDLLARAFRQEGKEFCLREAFKAGVRFARQDLRQEAPKGPFDLIFCRNLAFTYFAPAVQREALARLDDRLDAAGLLVIGGHEVLPDAPMTRFRRLSAKLPIYRKTGDSPDDCC